MFSSEIFILGFFVFITYSDEINQQKYVKVLHNNNLNKIAESVTLLFEEEIIPTEEEEIIILEELPSLDNDIVSEESEIKDKTEDVGSPLISISSSKYKNNEAMGFKVTEDNRKYSLSDSEFDVVVAVVAGEYGGDLNDALAVVSVILNRCDSKTWAAWAGSNPYKQVIILGFYQ